MSQSQLRVAFDGDAVLFSDESERIVKAHGLDRFFEHEKAHENKPLAQVLHTLLGTPGWNKKLPRTCPWLEPPAQSQTPGSSQNPARAPPQASSAPFSHLDPWLLSVSFYLFSEPVPLS